MLRTVSPSNCFLPNGVISVCHHMRLITHMYVSMQCGNNLDTAGERAIRRRQGGKGRRKSPAGNWCQVLQNYRYVDEHVILSECDNIATTLPEFILWPKEQINVIITRSCREGNQEMCMHGNNIENKDLCTLLGQVEVTQVAQSYHSFTMFNRKFSQSSPSCKTNLITPVDFFEAVIVVVMKICGFWGLFVFLLAWREKKTYFNKTITVGL